MRNLAAVLAVFAALGADPALAARYKASKVSFQDITGAVNIVTTGGEDVELTITQGKVYRTLTVTLEGDELIIAGEPLRFESAPGGGGLARLRDAIRSIFP